MNKIKYLVLTLLVIIVSFTFYKYNYKISEHKVNNDSTATIEYPVITKNSGIILGQGGEYKYLNKEEKKIVDDLNEINASTNDLKEIHNSTFVKYYDYRIAIFGEYSIKPSVPFYIYDIKNSRLLTGTIKNLNSYVGYTENKQYMISAYDDGIVYYKAGNYDLKLLPNSALREGETYSKTNEMVNEYDLSISTSTPAVLKAGVFSDTEYDGNYHKKLREVEYVLP